MYNHLYIGTSGYNDKDWRGKFYPDKLPQKEWLRYYAEHFKSVEINNSFYVAVKKETYERWYASTPADFTFSVKGHRYITQLKKLKDVDEAVELFFSSVSGLKEKLGVVLWQFPASFRLSKLPWRTHPNLLLEREGIIRKELYMRLGRFLKLLPASVRQAFEFRDPSWFIPEVNDLLKQHNASLVISQSAVFPEVELLNGTFAYIRFHGPSSLYSSGYSDQEMAVWAKKIKKYLKTMDVYSYFNNDAGGYAIENAAILHDIIY